MLKPPPKPRDTTTNNTHKKAEAPFGALLESAPDAIVIVDSDGRIMLVNTQAEKTFGYKRDELLGEPVEVLVPERSRDAHVGHRAGYHSEPRTRPMGSGLEFVARRKDGSEFPVDISLSTVETETGVIIISIIRDVTERKRAEEALRQAEEKFRSIFENAIEGIFQTSPDGRLLTANPALARMCGYQSPQELVALLTDIKHQVYVQPGRRAEFIRLMEEHGFLLGFESQVCRKDGSVIWISESARAVRDERGAVRYYEGYVEDITERKRAEEELQRLNRELEAERRAIEELNRSLERRVRQRTEELRLANQELQQRHRQLLDARAQAATDPLTGLFNHRTFHERIRDEVSRAQEDGSSVGLIMLDIDDFKPLNDSLGHLAGDQILRQLALTLAHVVKRADAYRYGGDEFAVLLPGIDPRKAARVAEGLRRAVARGVDGGHQVTVSLGVASFPATAASAEELIYRADAAMYWAKSAGKNRVGKWERLVNRRAGATYLVDRRVRVPDLVAALVAALRAKDPVTSAHAERCSWYATRLADELGLKEEDRSVVRLASLLHDIGKLAIPDEVLFKPGPLNQEEWAQMKRHPAAALHILGQVQAIADATPAILHHHERFDGSGYPDGLAGEDIPIAARILLVTDAFDAMTTDRPYRKAMPVERAIKELKGHSGSQFDPVVVRAFLKILSRYGPQPLHSLAAPQAGALAAPAPFPDQTKP